MSTVNLHAPGPECMLRISIHIPCANQLCVQMLVSPPDSGLLKPNHTDLYIM
jgi:hypothetical protein